MALRLVAVRFKVGRSGRSDSRPIYSKPFAQYAMSLVITGLTHERLLLQVVRAQYFVIQDF